MFKHRCLNIVIFVPVNLEREIKQTKPFASPYQKAAVNLQYTSNWLSTKMQDYFKDFGLTTKQYNIMRILKGADKPVSVAYIRERLLDKLSDASRIIGRMEAKDWVEKKTCPVDKRLVDIVLTKAGLELLTQVNKKIEMIDELCSNLSIKEIENLNFLLDKIRNNN